MRLLQPIFLFTFLLASAVSATHVAVLETGADAITKEAVSQSDRQYLTNILREEAVKQLPAIQNYTIMTRENINAMLPPGKSIEECEGSCLAETGRNISADYVCQARIGSFGGSLTLSAELYETAGNKLVASFNGQGDNVNALLEIIKQKAPEFFRSIKNSTGFSGVGGIGNFSSGGEFNYEGRKKFIVEIVTKPEGAIPTVDGKAIPKCTSTPCKVQLDEGSHRIVASIDRYDDAETLVDITQNEQKVELELFPAFGWLNVQPVLPDNVVQKGKLTIVVDENQMNGYLLELDPGLHNVRVMHPCFDPVEFQASIEKNKTQNFDMVMTRGYGALELASEYNNEPQAVAVYIDGVESGSTPFAGKVPLCSDVTLKGKDWTEKVDVTLKWHDVVQVTHPLKHRPDAVAMSSSDSVRLRANAAYGELNGKNPYEGLSLSGKISNSSKDDPNINVFKVVRITLSAVVATTGVILAVSGNSMAKKASEKGASSEDGFQKNIDDAKTGQTLRGVGIGLAIAGGIGLGLSIAF
jgi:hypothetical protein